MYYCIGFDDSSMSMILGLINWRIKELKEIIDNQQDDLVKDMKQIVLDKYQHLYDYIKNEKQTIDYVKNGGLQKMITLNNKLADLHKITLAELDEADFFE